MGRTYLTPEQCVELGLEEVPPGAMPYLEMSPWRGPVVAYDDADGIQRELSTDDMDCAQDHDAIDEED